MSELARIQRQLLDYLLGGDDGIRGSIDTRGPANVTRRLGIYSNAYRERLKGALENDHEMLLRYLGAEGFDRMALTYIRQHPSQYRSLRHFGHQLPDFLSQNDDWAVRVELAELARFERTLLDVFDAASAARASLAELEEMPAEAWPELRVVFHPSVRSIRFLTNAVSLWQALKMEQDPPPATVDDPTHWLLWRNRERISEFRCMDPSERIMLGAFQQGRALAPICEQLSATLSDEEVAPVVNRILVSWFNAGLVVSLVQESS